MNGMDPDARVALTEIKGDIRLMAERHAKYADDMKEMKDLHRENVTRLDNRLERHEGRITTLEEAKLKQDGALGAFKWLWAVGGGIVAAIVTLIGAIAARSYGV